jgi:hypothetical protein
MHGESIKNDQFIPTDNVFGYSCMTEEGATIYDDNFVRLPNPFGQICLGNGEQFSVAGSGEAILFGNKICCLPGYLPLDAAALTGKDWNLSFLLALTAVYLTSVTNLINSCNFQSKINVRFHY